MFTFIKKWFYGYILNTRTKEIHDRKNQHRNCRTNITSKKNIKYITKKQADVYLLFPGVYNGCRWCMKKQDNG